MFLALGTQHAVRMHHLWPVSLDNIFPPYLSNGTNFGGGKKIVENNICVFILSINLFEKFFILARIERDMIKMYMVSCKVPVMLVRF